MIVTVASGKGGTGKTSVAVNMALGVGCVQFLDCDVEEPNAHLLLHSTQIRTQPVHAAVPIINEALCSHCGACSKFCRYNALFTTKEKTLVFQELCHSCGGCIRICPQKAILEEQHRIGTMHFDVAGDLSLIYGELEVGKPLAVPVIKAVKRQIDKNQDAIVDSPPGTSCSFVETVRSSDFCLLVTEPTPFGLHDLSIAVEVLRKMAVPMGVVVNRAGIGDTKIYQYCKDQDIPILLEIPYDRRIAELYSNGIPFSAEMPQWKNKFQALYNQIRELTQQ
ncbi:MAG: ATP-binding protein [Candidatus Bathyarchaeota archaeon]|nr:ATP-binding protein [Candidatus Bathyarchaeota archaeon]